MRENFIPIHDLAGPLTGQFLISAPHIQDPRFERVVIYVCGHDGQGAMGIIVNKQLGDLTLAGLLAHLHLPQDRLEEDLPIYCGGPVDPGRGFILHSDDYQLPGTLFLGNQVALTATLEILQSISEGGGPEHCLLAMGYVEWDAGQLDEELQSPRWILGRANPSLLFHTTAESKWLSSLTNLGLSPERFSEEAGRA